MIPFPLDWLLGMGLGAVVAVAHYFLVEKRSLKYRILHHKKKANTFTKALAAKFETEALLKELS